jgi:hypothetical protein
MENQGEMQRRLGWEKYRGPRIGDAIRSGIECQLVTKNIVQIRSRPG